MKPYFMLTIFLIVLCSSLQAEPKLHPIKEVCVSYEMSGQMQNGTTTRCHRKYGYEQYELQNITVGVAGFTQTTNQHTVVIGDTIYSIDLDKNIGTKTKNPMYEDLVDSMQDKNPEEVSEAFIQGMGFTSVGTSQTIVGYECDDYKSSQLGTMCLTKDGLMLKQKIFGSTTLATKVEMGNSGDDANYTFYENVSITDGPDLAGDSFDLESLKDLMNQSQ